MYGKLVIVKLSFLFDYKLCKNIMYFDYMLHNVTLEIKNKILLFYKYLFYYILGKVCDEWCVWFE